MNLLPSTEIEAVNEMLATIGEAPIASLPTSGPSEPYVALTILHKTSRTLQQQGWSFNTEDAVELTPDSEGYINLPTTTLKVDIQYSLDDVVQRGTRLYNKTKHTFVFTLPVKVCLVTFLAFNDLPQAAKDYITIKASRNFSKKVLGSETLHNLTEGDEIEARSAFLEAESDSGDYSIFGSISTGSILNRGGYFVG